MPKRAKTTHEMRLGCVSTAERAEYRSGQKCFANLDPVWSEILDVIVPFAVSNCSSALRTLCAINKESRDRVVRALMDFKSPSDCDARAGLDAFTCLNVGGSTGTETRARLDSLIPFDSYTDRLLHLTRACHFCGRDESRIGAAEIAREVVLSGKGMKEDPVLVHLNGREHAFTLCARCVNHHFLFVSDIGMLPGDSRPRGFVVSCRPDDFDRRIGNPQSGVRPFRSATGIHSDRAYLMWPGAREPGAAPAPLSETLSRFNVRTVYEERIKHDLARRDQAVADRKRRFKREIIEVANQQLQKMADDCLFAFGRERYLIRKFSWSEVSDSAIKRSVSDIYAEKWDVESLKADPSGGAVDYVETRVKNRLLLDELCVAVYIGFRKIEDADVQDGGLFDPLGLLSSHRGNLETRLNGVLENLRKNMQSNVDIDTILPDVPFLRNLVSHHSFQTEEARLGETERATELAFQLSRGKLQVCFMERTVWAASVKENTIKRTLFSCLFRVELQAGTSYFQTRLSAKDVRRFGIIKDAISTLNGIYLDHEAKNWHTVPPSAIEGLDEALNLSFWRWGESRKLRDRPIAAWAFNYVKHGTCCRPRWATCLHKSPPFALKRGSPWKLACCSACQSAEQVAEASYDLWKEW